MMEFPVTYEGKRVGWGHLQRQGMYFIVRCWVQPPRRGKWKLWIHSGDKHQELGVLVPEGNGYNGVTRFSVKEYSPGEICFTIQPESGGKVELGGSGTVLSIKKLPSSRLDPEEGRYYLVYGEDQDSSKPTGQ